MDRMQQLYFAGIVMSLGLAVGCADKRPTAPLVNSTFIGKSNAAPATGPAERPVAAGKSPATAPTTQIAIAAPLPPANPEAIPVMLAPGQYQTVGGVASEVNGVPIYSNKVIRVLRAELAARAPEMAPEQYRNFAREEIRKKIENMERDELYFGVADRFLEGDDRRLAEYLAMQFRTRKITEAGGSVELAQRKAAADGDNFEELVYDQYRRYMTEIYFRQKLYPRIQITAEDRRNYYDANRVREYTEPEEVTFRLIKVRVDPRRVSGKEQAKARAADIAAKATTGDFAELARTMNDDARLARSGGQEVPVQKGAYRLEKVESALWTTPVGQITGVIEDSGGFYIAKVESRKDGKVQPFENEQVQESITKALRGRQFAKLTKELENNLRRPEYSWVRRDPNQVPENAVEMAMQGYAIWAKAGEKQK